MEISTIESDIITGRRMPWFPHAIIDILASIQAGVEVRNLDMGAILCFPTPLTREAFAELAMEGMSGTDIVVTNGWRTIEQLRRTAKLIADVEFMRTLQMNPLTYLERGISTRIRRNCDQLKRSWCVFEPSTIGGAIS